MTSPGLGNLVNRTVSLLHRYQDGRLAPVPPGDEAAGKLAAAADALPAAVDLALDAFDLRGATDAVRAVVDAANCVASVERPWELGRAAADGDVAAGVHFNALLHTVVGACRRVAVEVGPFVPGGAAKLQAQLGDGAELPPAAPVFPRLEVWDDAAPYPEPTARHQGERQRTCER
ncbi:methionine--tRNA ligase [Motilibacter peucedani]|uniref:hypothetical protein n=1 Tax=Motilibacter peucedani TaxID=598650 RepID=UPI001E4D1B67|nr:hypothetical protein [Motilibacter peucedani]